jgi:uncharacterized protein YggU (UPF0235/DUF167 family)
MSLIITIKVFPSSGQQKWMVDKAGNLKGYVKSPAQEGRANQELIRNLAKALKLPTVNFWRYKSQ